MPAKPHNSKRGVGWPIGTGDTIKAALSVMSGPLTIAPRASPAGDRDGHAVGDTRDRGLSQDHRGTPVGEADGRLTVLPYRSYELGELRLVADMYRSRKKLTTGPAAPVCLALDARTVVAVTLPASSEPRSPKASSCWSYP